MYLDTSASLEQYNILTNRRARRKPTAKLSEFYTTITAVLARWFAAALANASSATRAKRSSEPTIAKQARHHVCYHDEILIEVEEQEAHEENGTWVTVFTLPPGVFALPTK